MEKIYSVKNRSASTVVYTIQDTGVRREFLPGETKKIGFDELEKLSFQSGGRTLIANFLQVQESELNKQLNIETEEEYFMTENEVIDLIRTGTIEQFLDALDFAPLGIIELIKKFAIEIPMTDMNKIEALKGKTGFDVAKALAMKKAEASEEGSPEETVIKPKRRSNVTYKKIVTTENN